MSKERHVDALIKKLVQTIEASLENLLHRVAGAKTRGAFSAELTAQDKEFLRAVSIKPER